MRATFETNYVLRRPQVEEDPKTMKTYFHRDGKGEYFYLDVVFYRKSATEFLKELDTEGIMWRNVAMMNFFRKS